MTSIYNGDKQYHSPKSATEYLLKILNDPNHNLTYYDLELMENLSKVMNEQFPEECPVIEFVKVDELDNE
jgi:hypothetical protein